MTNIDWRAFWASLTTVIVALLIYSMIIEPIVKKYKIQVVKPDADSTKPEAAKKS